MKMIDSETKRLLDKLYNLSSKDSVILRKLTDDRVILLETKDNATKEKDELTNKINELNNEVDILTTEGNSLKGVLSSILSTSFDTVLNKLSLDFNPESILKKVETELPSTISSLNSEKNTASDNLSRVESQLNETILSIEEMELRYDEAISNQNKLNEFINLSRNGNINITRDALTSLLSKFSLSEVEQREIAKILMFPEDSLLDYDANVNRSSKTLSDVIAEAKTIIKEEPKIDVVKFEEIEKSNTIEEKTLIVEPVIIDPISPIVENEEIEKIVTNDDKSIRGILETTGINVSDLTNKDISFLEENYDEKTLLNNVNLIKDMGINNDMLVENIELFIDDELKIKIDALLEVGKVPFDIYLNPGVLVKYDASELNNSIAALKNSGLDPKKVPLMAY